MSAREAATFAAAAAIWCAVAAVDGQSRPASSVPPAGIGADAVRTGCLACHGADLIVQQRLSRDGWGRELDKMAGWGAVIDAGRREALVDYLTAHFGPDAPAGAAGDDDPGAALVQVRCVGCHDERLIAQQRLDEAGWRREVDKMIGWGAGVAPAEQAPLVAYLARRFGWLQPARRVTVTPLP